MLISKRFYEIALVEELIESLPEQSSQGSKSKHNQSQNSPYEDAGSEA